MENSRKIKLLKLWEILQQETDDEHHLTTNELIARLNSEGIEVDRKILYSDIKLLNEWGYDVDCAKGRSNGYYTGKRSFSVPEIRILMDAVQAAGFISEENTEDLVERIAALAGSKQAEVLKKNIVKFSTVKTQNKKTFYWINEIVSAIESQKQIEFLYFNYDIKREKVYRKDKTNPQENKRYVVNPVETVFDNDQYYLICYDDKHKELTNYRIDRMDKVRVLDTDINKYDKIEKIDMAKHKRQLFGMFGGEVKRVNFLADKSLIDVIFDKFGSGVEISQCKDGLLSCTVEVQASPMFIAWLCSFDTRIKVQSPPTVIKRVKEHLEKTLEQYN